MAITPGVEQIFNEMEAIVRDKGINTFKQFMNYKSELMKGPRRVCQTRAVHRLQPCPLDLERRP